MSFIDNAQARKNQLISIRKQIYLLGLKKSLRIHICCANYIWNRWNLIRIVRLNTHREDRGTVATFCMFLHFYFYLLQANFGIGKIFNSRDMMDWHILRCLEYNSTPFGEHLCARLLICGSVCDRNFLMALEQKLRNGISHFIISCSSKEIGTD